MDCQSNRPVLVVVGTRPEGIKMMPVYFALQQAGIPTLLCSTAQHSELLTQVFELFDVTPDIDLAVMRPGQDLVYLTTTIAEKFKAVIRSVNPSLVLVQGDTTTAMATALVAFYMGVPVGHIEAGLRTGDMHSPFPEEMNRRFVGMIATYHFTPTAQATAHLLAECVARESVFCTGNTVVDALRIIKEKILQQHILIDTKLKDAICAAQQAGKKIVLLTVHRRESFDGGIARVLSAVHKFLQAHNDVVCIYPYHPNPAVIQALENSGLATCPNLYLCKPLAYKELVYCLLHADVVATDSGGIQEEAVSLAKPVIVLREKSERMEGVWAGVAQLVGTNEECIIKALEHGIGKEPMSQGLSLYGDGYAAQKIVTIVGKELATRRYVHAHNQHHDERIKKEEAMKKVCILGLGYIGLPTALVVADAGFFVIGFDVDVARVERLASGDPVIQEPAIVERLQKALLSGNFIPTTQMQSADYFVIAVPTPFKDDHKADLSYVFAAAQSVAPVLKRGDVIIIESTIPVGTTQEVANLLQHQTGLKAGADFYVAHCPERVLPGNIFHELVTNARIIGGINKVSVEAAKNLYKPFVTGDLYLTDAATAEMVKLVENSSRDVQIAFAQQVASMAYEVGVDPYEIIELANKHPRVNILNPSCGVGGHCIAVDPWFLVEGFPAQTTLLKAAREVNDAKPYEVLATIQRAVAQWRVVNNNGECRVLLCGATYKANVDDLRESPALKIAQEVATWRSVHLTVVEPHISPAYLDALLGKNGCAVNDSNVQSADVIVFLVAHNNFAGWKHVSYDHKVVLDFCGLLHEPKKSVDNQEYQFWPARSEASSNNFQKHYKSDQDIIKECS